MDNISEANNRIAELEEELRRAKSDKKPVQLKVSEKGCVQINGIRRFPFTFYQNELNIILAMKDEIESFIENNQHKLAKKS